MKAVVTAIVLSTLSAMGFADATQFPVPTGSALTRAEVIAAINTPSAVRHHGDAVVFNEPQGSQLTRAEVLAEARADRAAHRRYGDSATLRFAYEADRAAPMRADLMAEGQRATTTR